MSSVPQSTQGGAVRLRPWWRRHLLVLSLGVLVVVAGILALWRPWESCGAGMRADGPDDACVGLNLEGKPFSPDDGMADLQRKIAQQNAAIGDREFVTVVLLNNMTPDRNSDSAELLNVQHGIAGAITAQNRANSTPVVGPQTPRVKLLLANYGTRARNQADAVREIVEHRGEQHIVAVIGLGQSLDNTRRAAAALSDQQIAVVSALASADNMNRRPGSDSFIERFYRITPTNVDAAKAAVSYLRDQRDYKRVMLVRDISETDIYARTLGEAFKTAYRDGFGDDVPSEQYFRSPSEELEGVSQDEYMQSQFDKVRARMCLEKPDLVYFAGRGADLKSFLRALGQNGACGLSKVDILTSDDASSLLGTQLPEMHSMQADVYYTSVATRGMWEGTGQNVNQTNYEGFEEAFRGLGLADDLRDGYAMSHHDALLLAIGAARQIPAVAQNPTTVADLIFNYDCVAPFPGATGQVAFTPDSHGNPINKALPVMRLLPNGELQKQALAWSAGRPFGPDSCG